MTGPRIGVETEDSHAYRWVSWCSRNRIIIVGVVEGGHRVIVVDMDRDVIVSSFPVDHIPIEAALDGDTIWTLHVQQSMGTYAEFTYQTFSIVTKYIKGMKIKQSSLGVGACDLRTYQGGLMWRRSRRGDVYHFAAVAGMRFYPISPPKVHVEGYGMSTLYGELARKGLEPLGERTECLLYHTLGGARLVSVNNDSVHAVDIPAGDDHDLLVRYAHETLFVIYRKTAYTCDIRNVTSLVDAKLIWIPIPGAVVG